LILVYVVLESCKNICGRRGKRHVWGLLRMKF